MFTPEELFDLCLEILKSKYDLSKLTPAEAYYKFVDIFVELKKANHDVQSDRSKWVY